MTDYSKIFSIVPDSTKEEALNPTSNLIGQAMRGIAHKVLDPLVKYNIVKDEEIKDFAEKTRKNTDAIPLENRDDSKLGLTFKATEDSVYQMHEETLREMFSNLISATVDNRKNKQVKPSFSSILKDLSVEEAELFQTLFKADGIPICSIRLQNKDTSKGFNHINNVILLKEQSIYNPSSLETLSRFGLVEINRESNLVANVYTERYKNFKTSSFYKDAEASLPLKTDIIEIDQIVVIEGSLVLTSLGGEFGKIVISVN